MWIAKGIALGLVFFAAFVVFQFVMMAMPFRRNTAIGLSAILGVTVANPYFWIGLICCVGLGVCIIASVPTRVQP